LWMTGQAGREHPILTRSVAGRRSVCRLTPQDAAEYSPVDLDHLSGILVHLHLNGKELIGRMNMDVQRTTGPRCGLAIVDKGQFVGGEFDVPDFPVRDPVRLPGPPGEMFLVPRIGRESDPDHVAVGVTCRYRVDVLVVEFVV